MTAFTNVLSQWSARWLTRRNVVRGSIVAGGVVLIAGASLLGYLLLVVAPNLPSLDVITDYRPKILGELPDLRAVLADPENAQVQAKANEELEKKFNSAVFPGAQGGPLMHVIAAKAVCFKEALEPGFHIRDALAVVASQHPDLIAKYGGHAMAAGLTLHEENFPLFAEAFDAEVRRQLREEDLTGRLLSDGTLAVEEYHLELARALRHAGPWGQHFPEPLFHGVFQLVEQRVVGERHLKVVLKSECGSVKLDGIAFGVDREVWPNPTVKWVELAYKLDVNEFRGNETVQLMIAHIEPR